MVWSRSGRIKTLLVIDSTFFFIEIIVGYAVGSLALVADSFHMLNDVCSLVVALYAIKLAENRQANERYSYGWQRAEILGALINGVFLLALCFSIFMEAIERFFNTTEVTNPRLVVIVGAFGLASNIVGLFLFHDHGHSHGGGGHSHSRSRSHSHTLQIETSPNAAPRSPNTPISGAQGTGELTPLLAASAPNWPTSASPHTDFDSGSDSDDPLDDIFVHPAQARDNVIRAAEIAGYGTASGSGHQASGSAGGSGGQWVEGKQTHSSFGAALGSAKGRSGGRGRRDSAPPNAQSPTNAAAHAHEHSNSIQEDPEDGHKGHSHGAGDHGHDHSDDDHDHGHGGGGGHDHGSMNMRGVFLHVLGDALGNVGVIAAGLLIWLTSWSGRFYFDPAISLVITVIIFSSALPLVRSASFILLQGTPNHVSLDRVRRTILSIPGVVSVHELHIWSLSESKLVASVHVLVGAQDDYAAVSRQIRKELHRFGVHSSTIQPEILGNPGAAQKTVLQNGMVPPGLVLDESGCLVQCDDHCAEEACCPPGSLSGSAGDAEERAEPPRV